MSALQHLITEHIDIWTAADTEKKSGRGRASSNAGSVYGIKKLRELILELAVRGKLVPQNANDEPASELIKRIQTEKAKLVAEGKIRKDKPLGVIIEAEKIFDLPNGWEWVRFNDYATDISTGPFGSMIHQSDYVVGGIPLINPSHMIGDEIVPDESISVSTEMARKLGAYTIYKGDIVMARRGEVGRIALVTSKENGWLCGTGSFALRFSNEIHRDYLRVLFRCVYARTYLAGEAVGTTMVNLNHGILKKMPIGLPPLEEQHRIVAKVDELMALCDQLEAQHSNAADAHEQLVSHLLGTLTQSQDAADFNTNWQRIATHFDTLFTTESSIDVLKQTLLQLAVMGKLVPQDPNDEPASELLKQIQIEKAKLIAEGKIKKDKPLSEIGEIEKPYQLPKGWNWARMIDCAQQITDGEHLTPERTVDSTKIPLVTAKNVRDGNMDYTDTDFVDFHIAAKCWNRCKPELNDILIVSVGATIGRLTIIDDHRDMVIVRSVTLIKPLQIHIPYLALALRSPLLQKSIWAGVKQNAQPCLYLSVSTNLPIPVPPLSEQRRIIAKIGELMSLCDQLKSRITDVRLCRQKLADVLVTNVV
ncbi:restriction endonuclease subunit S [Undibacterium sp. Ji83W]|uniref:restriction endonuclease subunit S n=1 Tax=Undibacterium sp. Ji83W TaxID=3413043 RepID=UPI003BF0A2B8